MASTARWGRIGGGRRLSVLIALIVGLVVVLPVVGPIPVAEAEYCDPNRLYDCKNPNTICTGYTTITFDTIDAYYGSLEGRYRYAPCRTIWGRIDFAQFSDLWTVRITSAGSTLGRATHSAGSSRWSDMLDDANEAGRARVVTSNDLFFQTKAY